MEYTDVFLTHDWGEDEIGRSNHVRVSKVNKFLQSRGLKTWFDEERMTGNIRDKMAEGIENTKLILVFITEKYRNKVNSNNAIDNCYFEFNYATLEKSGNFMIPVVMEPRMRNPRDWKGRLGAELGTHLYVDLSEEDPEIFDSKCKELHALIEPLIAEYDKTHPPSTSTVQPVHHHPHHQIHHKEGSAEPVHGDSKHTQPQPTGGKSNSLKTNAMAVLSIAGSMKQPSTNTNNSPLAALQALNSHNNHITTPNNLTKAAQNILSPPNSTTSFSFSSSLPSTTSETSTESTLSNSLPSNGGKFSFASSFLKSLNDHPPSSSLISSTSVHPVASSTTPKINLPSVTETSPFLQQNKAPHAQVNISTTFPSHDSHTSSFTVPKFTFGSRLPETITHNHDSSSTTTENGNFKKCPWCSSKNHANAVNCILCKKPIDGSHSSSSGSNSSKKICPWCHGKNELTSTKCSICSNSLENRHLPSDLLEEHLLNDGGNNGNVNVKVLNRSSNAGEGYDTTGIKRSPRLSLQTGSFIINHLNTVKGHAPTSNAGVSTENHIPSISFTI
eukprot:gene10319-11224_t